MRRSLRAASAAAVGAVLLVGGGVTWAGWSDVSPGGTAVIRAGDLQVAVTQSGPAAVQLGDAPPGGVLPVAGSSGLIPGTQGQRWTYRVTNTGASAVPASATLRLRTASVSADYGAVRAYLRARVNAGAGDVEVPSAAFEAGGLSYDVPVPGVLQPGASATVTLVVYLPATVTVNGRSVPVGMELRNLRSANLTPSRLFTMGNVALLRQAPEN